MTNNKELDKLLKKRAKLELQLRQVDAELAEQTRTKKTLKEKVEEVEGIGEPLLDALMKEMDGQTYESAYGSIKGVRRTGVDAPGDDDLVVRRLMNIRDGEELVLVTAEMRAGTWFSLNLENNPAIKNKGMRPDKRALQAREEVMIAIGGKPRRGFSYTWHPNLETA